MKAVITFIDEPDGRIDVKAVFDPPLGKGGSTDSEAQNYALRALLAITRGEEVSDIVTEE